MPDLLPLTGHLPEVDLAPGEILIEEDTRTGSIWVLVSGTVEIRKHGAVISTLAGPGTCFGEIALLLDSDHTASVVALEPCRFRHAADGRQFLLDTPEVLLAVAGGMAARLDVITGYLADLRNQYADAPGIAMVSTVLGRLSSDDGPPIRPGSARDPDPEY